MANTQAGLDDRILEDGDEPVLVWAVTEDILLANDAALLLLARTEDAGEVREVRTALARTVARVVNAEGPYHRASVSVRFTDPGRASGPRSPAPPSRTGEGWAAAVRRILTAAVRRAARLSRDR